MNESAILAYAPSPETFDAGKYLVTRGDFSGATRTTDEKLIFARCRGSAAEPYEVSADFLTDPPTGRCSCPSRKRPCKHVVGLLLLHAQQGASFAVGEAPEELLKKRQAVVQKAEKVPKPKKARAPNKEAEEKKARTQLEGLDAAEKVLRDLATSGLGSLDKAGLAALETRARELADFHLPGMALGLRRLAGRLEDKSGADVKAARCARALASLWTMVRKGRAVLGHRVDGEDPSVLEADAFVEELLGKVWQLAELKEKGFLLPTASWVEVAYEQVEDAAREEQLETAWLLELGSGDIHRDTAYVPLKRVGKAPPKASRDGVVVTVKEAALYPGLGNRRVRWEDGAETTRPFTPEDARAVLAQAQTVAAAVSAFTAQLKNLLAPDERVMLLQVKTLGSVGKSLVLEDAAGDRMALCADERGEETLSVLGMVGWPRDAAAVVASLVPDFATGKIEARVLSVVSPSAILRLAL